MDCNMFGFPELAVFLPLIIAIALFDAVLKIVAMWKAARRNELLWFVLIAVLNTAGILPLVYILLRRKEAA